MEIIHNGKFVILVKIAPKNQGKKNLENSEQFLNIKIKTAYCYAVGPSIIGPFIK